MRRFSPAVDVADDSPCFRELDDLRIGLFDMCKAADQRRPEDRSGQMNRRVHVSRARRVLTAGGALGEPALLFTRIK